MPFVCPPCPLWRHILTSYGPGRCALNLAVPEHTPQWLGSSHSFDQSAYSGPEKSRRGCQEDNCKFEWPQVVVGRIVSAVGNNQARVRREESTGNRQRHDPFPTIHAQRKEQPREECKEGQRKRRQNVVLRTTRRVLLKFPEKHCVEQHSDHDCDCKSPFFRRHRHTGLRSSV